MGFAHISFLGITKTTDLNIQGPKMFILRNLKTPKGHTEIVKSEDRQDHGQQNETKDKYRTHNTTLKTKARVTRILQKLGSVQVLRTGNCSDRNIFNNF